MGEVEAVAEPSAEVPEARALKILLVEDDFLIRLNAADILRELGHDATEAGSAEEAMPLLKAQKFDILLTDIGLPTMPGTELAVHARENDPVIGVVFATGHNSLPAVPGDRPAVLLQKPYDTFAIAAALAKASG